jgi:hypothetical protein
MKSLSPQFEAFNNISNYKQPESLGKKKKSFFRSSAENAQIELKYFLILKSKDITKCFWVCEGPRSQFEEATFGPKPGK